MNGIDVKQTIIEEKYYLQIIYRYFLLEVNLQKMLWLKKELAVRCKYI